MTPERATSRKVAHPHATSVPGEFVCTDCGIKVRQYLPPLVPRTRCYGYDWIRLTPDPERRESLRASLIEHQIIGAAA